MARIALPEKENPTIFWAKLVTASAPRGGAAEYQSAQLTEVFPGLTEQNPTRKLASQANPAAMPSPQAAQLSLNDNLAKATEALRQQDLLTLVNTVHTLKGMLLQCGLNDLAAIAGEIDKASEWTATCSSQPFRAPCRPL